MNKKVMAIAMAAVMLMVAVTVGVSAQSDAEGNGTADLPKYIIGESSKPVVSYPGDTIKGKIEFNRTAFTDGASVGITYAVYSGSAFGTESETITSDVADIATVQEGASSIPVPGKYTVTVTPKSVSTDSSLKVRICITIKETPICGKEAESEHTHSGTCWLPEQKYYYAVNVQVLKSGATIELKDGNARISSKVFNFEEDVKIVASVVKGGSEDTSDAPYLYYATGLPNGISMRIDGTIGGKIDSSLNTNSTNQTAKVYAVSNSGKVISTDLSWTIGQKSVPYYFTLNVDVSTDDISGGYITAEKGSSHTLDVVFENGYSALDSTLKVTGADGAEITAVDGKYNIMGTASGTGKFTVTVSADVKKADADDSSAVHVVKSFNVYVIGNIVDADLDPSVTSK